MNPLTRRTMLMLAGVAGFEPLIGSAAADAPAPLPNRCLVVIKDGLQILIKNRFLTDGEYPIPVKYEPVDGDANSLLLHLPWASNQVIKCPRTVDGKPLMQHTFTFESVKLGTVTEIKNGGGKQDHVRITFEATYEGGTVKKADPKGASCTFECDGSELIVPAGHSILCNGVVVTCPAMGKR